MHIKGLVILVNKIKSFINYLFDRKILFSIYINAFFLVGCLILYKPSFETNDDVVMLRMISGFNGYHNSYLIFINRIIGLFLKMLYSISQSLPWYELLQYSICFTSMTVITYFLLNTIKNRRNVIFILNIFFVYELFIKTQFTKTAGVATFAGLLLIMYFTLYKDYQKKYLKGIILGVILAILGFCYRQDMFLLCTFSSTVFGFLFLLKYKKYDKNVFIKKIVACLLTIVVVFVSVGALYVFDKHSYSTPEWKERFDRYEKLCYIYDYNRVNFNKDLLKKNNVKLSKIDYSMLLSWDYEDPEVFSDEYIEKLSKCLEKPKRNIVLFLKNLAQQLLINHYFPFLLFVAFFIIYLFKNKFLSYESLAILYTMLTLGIYYIYMYFKGRVFINRVESILWLISTVFIITLIDGFKKFNIKQYIAIALSVFLLFMSYTTGRLRIISDYNSKNNFVKLFSKISDDPEHLYLSSTISVYYFNTYDMFDKVEFGGGTNFYPLGGWTSVYDPSEKDKLKRFDITNPLKDIINNDKVYLIDTNIQNKVAFIRKHYDENARAVKVKTVKGIKIYKIVSDYNNQIN